MVKFSLFLSVLVGLSTSAMAVENSVRGSGATGDKSQPLVNTDGVDAEFDKENQSHRELFTLSFADLMYKIGKCKYPGQKKICPPCHSNKEPRHVCHYFYCYDDGTCVPPEDVSGCGKNNECVTAHYAYYGRGNSDGDGGGGDGDAAEYQEQGGNNGGDNGGNNGGNNGGGNNGGNNRNQNYDLEVDSYYSSESTTVSSGGSIRDDNHSATIKMTPFYIIAAAMSAVLLFGALAYRARSKKNNDLKAVLVDDGDGPKVVGIVSRRLKIAKHVLTEQEAGQIEASYVSKGVTATRFTLADS